MICGFSNCIGPPGDMATRASTPPRPQGSRLAANGAVTAVKRKFRRDDFMMGTPYKTLKYRIVEVVLQPFW